MRYSFRGQSALVTGAASGIGEATARLLAANGLSVVVSDLKADAVERVVAAITAAGGRAVGHVADVSSAADAKATVDRAIEAFGALHFAVNNAGIVGPATAVGELEPADWRARHRCQPERRGLRPAPSDPGHPRRRRRRHRQHVFDHGPGRQPCRSGLCRLQARRHRADTVGGAGVFKSGCPHQFGPPRRRANADPGHGRPQGA